MSRYSRGADFERVVKRDLERRGYLAYRSAGSHGAADVIALCEGHMAILVQCKTNGRICPGDRTELLGEARIAGAVPMLASKSKSRIIYQIVGLAGVVPTKVEP